MARALVKNSESPSGIDTNARLTFSRTRFRNGILSGSNRIFRTINGLPGYVKGSRPLNDGEWFNIKLNEFDNSSKRGILFHIGLTYDSEENDPKWHFDNDITQTWCDTVSSNRYVFYGWGNGYSVTMGRPKIGDKFSVSRTEDGLVIFRYNGIQQNGTSTSRDGRYPYVYMYRASEIELLS